MPLYATKKKTDSDRLKQLLEIASESGLEPPKPQPTALERIIGLLRSAETSGIAADIQSGKGLMESLGNYGQRLGKGLTGQGLTKEDLSGVEGYKEVLTRAGVSDQPLFELGPIKPSVAGIAGFAGDIFLDPSTYLTGGLTKLGKQAAKTAGKETLEALAKKATTNVARDIVEKGTQFAGKRTVEKLGGTATEQAALGQRGLINVFGKSLLPRGVSKAVYETSDTLLRKLGETQVGKTIDSFRKIFKDDLVPLAAKGTPLETELTETFAIKRLAKNKLAQVDNYTNASLKRIEKEAFKVGGKDIVKVKSVMAEVEDIMEHTKPGESLAYVREDIRPLAEEVRGFRDYVNKMYTEVGGGNLTDDEVSYWIHALTLDEFGKVAKGAGFSAREFTDKVASDYVRNYGKVVGENGEEFVGHIKTLEREHGLESADSYIGNLTRRAGKIKSAYNNKISKLETQESTLGKAQIGRFLKGKTKGESLIEKRTANSLNIISKIDDRIKWLEEQTLKGLRYPITKEQAEQAATNKIMKSIREASVRMFDANKLKEDIANIPLASGRTAEFNISDDLIEKILKELEDLKIEKKIEEIELKALGHGGVRRLTPKQAFEQGQVVVKKAGITRGKIGTIRDTIKDFKSLIDDKLKEIDDILAKVDFNKTDKFYFKRGMDFTDEDLVVPSALKREIYQFKNATVKEINDTLGFEKFSTDLFYTTYLMGKRIGKKAAGSDYLNLATGLGRATSGAPEGWVKSTAPFFKGRDIVFRPEIAKQIDNTYKAYFSDEALNDVLNIFDKVQNIWKTSVTSVWPAFHTRNFVSNIWQNWLGDVNNPQVYTDALEILYIKKTGGVLSEKQEKLYQSFLDNALSGYGFFGGDLPKGGLEELTTKGQIKKLLKLPETGGKALGNAVEDLGKLAHFMDKINKGYSSVDAAASVRKYLFDYTDLSDTEKYIFKRISPFYCVPDTSEILTKFGFKTHQDLIVGEEVITYNVEKDCLEWKPVLEVAVFDYDQNIRTWENKRHKLYFTPNHRWVYKRNKGTTIRPYGIYKYPETIGIKESTELTKQDYIKVSSKYSGGGDGLDVKSARLLGWLLTDGYFRWRGGYCGALIYQHPKKFLREVIEVSGGVPRKPHPQSRVVAVPVIKENLKPIEHLIKRNKQKDDWVNVVTEMSKESLEAMYDAMYKGDGTGKGKQRFFACQLDGVGKTFEVLATLLGCRIVKNDRGFYISDTQTLGIKDGKFSEEPYFGKVWCPKTENETWVMKQGKLITITGNTFTRKNLPMELEALMTNPGKFSTLAKGMRVAGYDPNQEGVPTYMREQPSFRVGEKFLSGGVLGIPAFEPLEMIGETPARSLEKTLSKSLGPLLKVPLETATDRSLYQGRPLSEVRGVEKIWGDKIDNAGLSDKFGLQKLKDKSGNTYYTTSNPALWNTLRNVFARVMNSPSAWERVKNQDLNDMYALANAITGIVPKSRGEEVKAMYDKETEKKLFEFLRVKGKAYEFSLYSKSKQITQ